MIEFDEWYISDDAPEQPSLPDAYGAGQQAKIDCMQVRIDGANERALSILNHKNVMADKMQAEIDELQGRIDAALEKCYTGIRRQGGDYYLELVENILKGK